MIDNPYKKKLAFVSDLMSQNYLIISELKDDAIANNHIYLAHLPLCRLIYPDITETWRLFFCI